VTGSRKLIAGVVALVGLMGAFWYLALAPKQKEATRLRSEVVKVQASNGEVRTKIVTLKAAERSYATNYASVARLGKAVPADDDVRSLLVQLDSAAKRSGVGFDSIELSAASAAPAPAAAGSTTQAATATLPPGAAVGPAGLPTMPFSFKFDGTFFGMSEFFARLERFVKAGTGDVDVTGRLLALDGFSLEPGEAGFPSVTASIGATAYLVPEEEGAMGGGTTTGPTPGVASPAGGGAATPASAPPAPSAPPAALSSTGAIR